MICETMLRTLLPLACEWAEAQENAILQAGTPLGENELADARAIGVRHPDRVRLLAVEAMPLPQHPMLRLAAEDMGFLSPITIGVTLRYGIWIRADHWGERRLIIHELVHTSQYERLGGIEPFLSVYLRECLTKGYPNGALEAEARRVECEICARTR